MSTTDPETARLEHRLWHYELAVSRFAQNDQSAEGRRILAELEGGLKKANEDADAALNKAPRVVGDTWVLLVQEMDPETREIRKRWKPWGGPHLYMGSPTSSDFLKSVARDVLDKLGRRSSERGYAGLTSSADGLADDLMQGHVLTLDDGTSLQLVQADLVAAIQD